MKINIEYLLEEFKNQFGYYIGSVHTEAIQVWLTQKLSKLEDDKKDEIIEFEHEFAQEEKELRNEIEYWKFRYYTLEGLREK